MKDLMNGLLVFLTAFTLASCGDDTPVSPDPTPTPTDGKGEVSFEISSEGGTGSGTGTSPIELSQGDTLNMAISQKSKYTDSEGNVFECEPKAAIRLFAELDTVYADKLEKLTDIQEKAEVQTSQEGKSPVTNRTLQIFRIGSQSVQFDLSYEIFSYTTADGNIEMPYAMLHEAVFGNADAAEGAGTRAVVRNISVKPLPQTRASVSDTTWYEVNAVFNLDVECMNANDAGKQNLTFSVTYRGAVTTEIELPDPVKALSHTIQATGGTASTSSPFVANPGETMNLLFKQASTYTDSYGNLLSCEPEARISLSTETDTLYVQAKEDLEGVPASQNFVFNPSGENPLLYSATQWFELGTQHLRLEMSYEIYTATDMENNEIEMPYLKQNATITSAATVSELSTATGERADTTFYEVRVPIKLETVYVGTAEENVQTTEIVASYIGAVVTWKEEPELVRVEYRTGYVWEEAHDNLPLLYYAKVYRDRYYSNGEVFTDEFVDNGHPAELNSTTGINTEFPCEEISRSEQRNDSIWTSECIVAVNDMSTFDPYLKMDEMNPGNWSEYVVSKLYENVNLEQTDYTGSENYESTSLQSGWYFQCFSHCQYMGVQLDGQPVFMLYADSRMYDQFLSIDGKIINFLEHKPVRNFSHNVEDAPQYSKGKRLTNECTTYYLGRKFYTKTVLILYQK